MTAVDAFLDKKLVSKVVQHVLEMLKQQGLTLAANPTPSSSPSADQKKDAAGPPYGRSARGPANARRIPEPPAALPSKRFVTAGELKGRIAGGTIELAPDEFLTPGAQDVVTRMQLTVRKAEKPSIEAPASLETNRQGPPEPKREESEPVSLKQEAALASDARGAVGLVIGPGDSGAESVVRTLQHEGVQFRRFSEESCWRCNLEALCGAVAEGTLALGVAILPRAAAAAVIANKFSGVRAVQGAGAAVVEAAVREFAANVLTLDSARCTFHEMKQMVRAFGARGQGRGADGALIEAIRRLEQR